MGENYVNFLGDLGQGVLNIPVENGSFVGSGNFGGNVSRDANITNCQAEV